MTTLAERITTAVSDLARDITTANGYATDAGLRVYRGRAVSGPDDLLDGPLVVVGVPDDGETETPVQAMPDKMRQSLRLTVTALALAESEADPLDTAHALLGDLKRALLRPEPQLRPRDAGTVLGEEIAYAGATLYPPAAGEKMVSASLTLTVRYSERRGDPSTT